jgi:hypothetical protein
VEFIETDDYVILYVFYLINNRKIPRFEFFAEFLLRVQNFRDAMLRLLVTGF